MEVEGEVNRKEGAESSSVCYDKFRHIHNNYALHAFELVGFFLTYRGVWHKQTELNLCT